MKVIFLDIDGVLNSMQYYTEHEEDMEKYPIDRECVRRLGDIVAATRARIVLSSSWRLEWSRKPEQTSEICQKMVDMLAEYGMEIYDKTGRSENYERGKEISQWLSEAPERVESFVILDDGDFDWKKYGLLKHWIKTDFCSGGLREEDISRAVGILRQEKKEGIWDWFFKRFPKGGHTA